jgi:hypothetical protein
LDNFVGLHFAKHSYRTFATAIKQIRHEALFVTVGYLPLNLKHSQIKFSQRLLTDAQLFVNGVLFKHRLQTNISQRHLECLLDLAHQLLLPCADLAFSLELTLLQFQFEVSEGNQGLLKLQLLLPQLLHVSPELGNTTFVHIVDILNIFQNRWIFLY